MLNKLQYQIHQILQSKYKFLITILIYFTIYLSFYSNNIIYCMTEDTNLIADAKPSARPIPGPNTKSIVQREIEHFINMASVVDEKNDIITAQARDITFKNNSIQQLNTEKTHLVQVLAETRERLQVSESKVRTLTNEIEGGPYRYGYKRTIADLELKLGRTQTKLEISEKLLAESKKDKDRLYSLVEKTINRIK